MTDSARETGASGRRAGRILLVDDDPLFVRSLARLLSSEHTIEVSFAVSDALSRVEAGRCYDVILCDLAMPDGGGVEFYRALLSRWPAEAVRLVLVTGYPPGSAPRAPLAGMANVCLMKPFDIEELRALLRSRVAER